MSPTGDQVRLSRQNIQKGWLALRDRRLVEWLEESSKRRDSSQFHDAHYQADDHPMMQNYHKPNDEKRMIVILHDDQYDDWLSAGPDESRDFLRQYPAELLTSTT